MNVQYFPILLLFDCAAQAHGGWTPWSPWTACSQSCGTAMRSRMRSCNPAPQFGGRVCIGQERIDENCVNNPPCPVPTKIPLDGGWTRWTEWEACTAECGGGFQRRYRSCTNPPPQNGGVHCDGNNEQWRTCNSGTCNEIRKSSAWTGWVIRNITNGGYIQQRFQFMCRASIPVDSALQEPTIRMQERFCLESGEDCTDSANGNSPPQFTTPPILVIKEDQPIGSVIGTLRATDSDGDSLTFSVSASGSSFNLVQVSTTPGYAVANITLKSQLNYETVTQFAVGFTVSDGVNLLTRTVTVYVVNVNDNTPLFSKVRYIADVLESTPVGTQILTVEAFDPDYGPPTYYFYSKDSDSISQNVGNFRIDQTTGNITLITPLDFEKDAEHSLMVMARDQYGWNSTATVFVRVGDVPEEPLITSPQDCYDVFKAGNATPGVYTVYPSSDVTKSKPPAPLMVYCEDGWTYLQRRSGYRNHYPVNFDRGRNVCKDILHVGINEYLQPYVYYMVMSTSVKDLWPFFLSIFESVEKSKLVLFS